LATGREPRNDKEAIFDRVLAQRHNLALGDSVEILDRDFVIVGLSEGTASWMTSFVFIRKPALETLLSAPGATSFLLVTPSERVGIDELRRRLSDLSSIEVTPKSTVIANDLNLYGSVFSGPLRLMVAMAV
jgi:putative ABC transport system permease protein